MTYNEFIQNILESRGRYILSEEYKERHHVEPKCCGGADDEDNIIELFANEHYEAHRLLAQENPDNSGLRYAWIMMSLREKNKTYQTAEAYALARIALSEFLKNRTYSEETHEKMRKAAIGNKRRLGTKTSEIGLQHIREAAKLKGPMTEETKKKIGDGNRGKTVSEESRKKISEARKGIKFSEEHKEKLSEWQKGKPKPSSTYKHTHEQGQKAWETRRLNGTDEVANKGKICITDGIKNAYISPDDVLPEGWKYGSTQLNHVKTYNRTWVNDETYAYFVPNEELEEYLNKGYHLGKNKLKTKKEL